MTELEQIMLQALQDMQTNFKADLSDSERSFREALTDLEVGYTQQVQRWDRELAGFMKAQQNLQSMFNQVSAENARLSAQVNGLTAQMETLTKLLNSLSA